MQPWGSSWQPSYAPLIAYLTWPCMLLFYTIRRIWPFLSTNATQVLVQSFFIAILDWQVFLCMLSHTCNCYRIWSRTNWSCQILPRNSIVVFPQNDVFLVVATCIRVKPLMFTTKPTMDQLPPYWRYLASNILHNLPFEPLALLDPPLSKICREETDASRLSSASRWWNELLWWLNNSLFKCTIFVFLPTCLNASLTGYLALLCS